MGDYSLKVIPKPKEGTATVIQHTKKGKISLIMGTGNDNYSCGVCSNILAKNVVRRQIANIVLMCPNCDAYNIITGT